jgi:enoyl-CoA hydratase/carnithine racemase
MQQVVSFEDYSEKYEIAQLQRDSQGILEVRLHTNGGQLIWNEPAHRELSDLWSDIGEDYDNRVVILTGTGDAFCETSDRFDLGERGWDKLYWEGKRLLRRLLEIEVPVISAVNGPALIHAELVVMSDIVLCAEHTIFQDGPHRPRGVVPGDGVHLVWPELLGLNRGRYFLLTGQQLSAEEALNLGVVSEVLPVDRLLPRAREHAEALASMSTKALRYTRECMTMRWKQLLGADLGYGLLLEGAAHRSSR